MTFGLFGELVRVEKMGHVVQILLVVLAVVNQIFIAAAHGPNGNMHDDQQQGPSFTLDIPTRLDFSNSSEARVECRAKGQPAPSVYWLHHDGSPVSESVTHRKILNNGTMLFLPFRGEDYVAYVHAATYRCVARNTAGSIISRALHVRAVVDQLYDIQVYDEFVIAGNTAVLKCHIPSFVREHVKVTTWFVQQEGRLHTPVHSGGRFVQTPNGELHIVNVEPKDSQVAYRCETAHRLTGQTKLSTPGKIVVTDVHNSVSPRITHSSSVVHAIQGDSVQLPCEAQGFPVPTNRWYVIRDKEPQPIASNERIREMFSFLWIERVQLKDESLYRCIVTNSVGEERVDTVLRVRGPLHVKIVPSTQTVDVGKVATFTCSPNGHPVTSVTWYKDGRPLALNENRRLVSQWTLRLNSVGKQDRGMYQCFIRNSDDEAEDSGELKLGDVIPVLDSVFEEMTVQPGSHVSIHCIASGQPLPTIHWTLDDQSFPAMDIRYRFADWIDEHGRLNSQVNVSGIRVEDGGQYRCLATNRAGRTHYSAKVHIVGRPWIRPMPNTSVVAGTTAYIHCRALGYPIHTITWELDDVTLPTIRRQQVLDNGTLILQDVSKAFDEGTYKCVARNKMGDSATRSISIFVMVPPMIDPFVFPRLLYEGMRARVSCVVTKGDLPITFSWLKDLQPLESDSGVAIRQDDHFSSSITFSSITPSHSGNYSCIAKNSADTVNHTAFLLVNVPPRWGLQPSDKSASFHTTVSFDCEANGTPAPKINWKKAWSRGPADYRDVLSSIMTAVILTNNTLVLEKVTESDEGYYLCEANNGVGTGLSKVVYLTVRAAAYFDSSLTNHTVRADHNARLLCKPKGDLPLTITWSMNNAQIDSKLNPKFEIRTRDLVNGLESELTVNRAQRSDTGFYKCRASNAYGAAETLFALLTQEVPNAPTNFKVLEHSGRKIHLEWTAPFDGNSFLIGYIVQYKRTTENWRSGGHNVSVDSTQTASVIHGLIPGSSYNVRVMAQNAIGISEPSDSIGISTSEEAPSGPPLEVEAIATASQSLKITWKSPRMDFRNGVILGYYVGYRPYDSSEPYMYETVTSNKVGALPEEVLLKNLKKFTKYGMVVKAFNSVGTGPNSDEIVSFTSEDVPSESPQNVRCTSAGTQSVHVTWQPPSPSSQNGVLKGYKIFYNLVSTSGHHKLDSKFVVISAKSHETSLTGLEKYSNYSVQVAAMTQVGDGVRSEHHYCRTREDVPGSPNDIKALVSSSTSILISWTAPKKPNGIIKKYYVYWSSKQDTHKRAVKISVAASGDLTYNVQGLSDNSWYDFWVTASTNIGEGESTSVVSLSTHHKVQSRIASFPSKFQTAWRSTVKLPCTAVGTPTPNRQWTFKSRAIVNKEPYSILENGTLVVRGVERNDAGNYSCRVENIYGVDEVEHELVVLAPPLPPSITIHKITQNSIFLTWKSRDENNYLISAYKLKYKRDFGGWEEMTVDASQEHVILKNLHCGTRYQVALQAENSIGHGEASKAITVTTKGAVPKVPSKESVLKWNRTSATIRLAGWPDGGCPVRHYVIQYRPKSQRDYILVSNNVIPEQEVLVIGDLRPMIAYVLHVTVHNDAGSTYGEYEFTTGVDNGENFASDDAKLTSSSFGLETSVIVAVTFPCILLLTVLIIVCLVIRHKKNHGYQQSPVTNNCHNEYQSQNEAVTPEKRQLQNLPLDRHFEVGSAEMESPMRMNNHVPMIHDDVCPYATFNLPRNEMLANDAPNSHLHLRAFTEGQDTLKQKRYNYDNNRKSPHLQREQYSYLPISPTKPNTTIDLDRYIQHFANTDDNIEKENDVETVHYHRNCYGEIAQLSSVHCNGQVGGDYELAHLRRYVPKMKLAYLTESAVQLFEEATVPDLLYRQEDGRLHTGTERDLQIEEDSDGYGTSSEIKLYSNDPSLSLTRKKAYFASSCESVGIVR